MSPVLTTSQTRPPVDQLGRLAGPAALVVFVAVLFAVALDAIAAPPTVEQITIENRTSVPVEVALGSRDTSSVLWVAALAPGARTRVDDVTDPGPAWVVRAEHAGRELGELHRSRASLAEDGWRIVIPAGWDGRGREGA